MQSGISTLESGTKIFETARVHAQNFSIAQLPYVQTQLRDSYNPFNVKGYISKTKPTAKAKRARHKSVSPSSLFATYNLARFIAFDGE